jgi:hypothetical protein
MRRTVHYAGQGVATKRESLTLPSNNHFAGSLSKEASTQIAEMGLTRLAGNVYECKSSQDFWKISDSGGLVRLTNGEVDNGEKIAPAPKESADTSDFLQSILADLEF